MLITTFLFACVADSKSEGTIVGNPGKVNTLFADSNGLIYDQGEAWLSNITYIPKGPNPVDHQYTIEIDKEIDLLNIESHLEIKGGEWDIIKLEFFDLFLEGETTNTEENLDFILEMESFIIPLRASQHINIDMPLYVLEIGKPEGFDDIDFESLADEDGFIDINEDNDNTEFVLELAFLQAENNSSLFEDLDEDGQISQQEREYPVATANEEEVENGNIGTSSNTDVDETDVQEDPDEINGVDNSESTQQSESYSYSSGCSESSLNATVFSFICLMRTRRKNNNKIFKV